tara:strand:- start:1544 stop:3913 length:2370 start_codon:yes stop_codon:yes gene_type:complete
MALTEGEKTGGIDEEKDYSTQGEVLNGKATTDTNKGNPHANDAQASNDGKTQDKEKTKLEYVTTKNLQTNILEQFVTHNQIWSLYCLSPHEMQFPDDTYMKSEPVVNIIRGGGGGQNIGEGRRVTTAQESQSPFSGGGGRVEYYIDNVMIESVLGQGGPTRMPPVHQFRFEVTEPYSMGMFLEALQIAAQTNGYNSYIDAPMCLVCDFVGHTDDGQTKRVARRYFPIQMSGAVMTVDAGGTKYECEAIATSGAANRDSVQRLQTDVTVIGGTVEQALQSGSQSLTRVMNSTLLEREATETQAYADEYIILFPKAEDIASKKQLENDNSGGEAATYDPEEEYRTRYGDTGGKQDVNYEEWFKNVTGFSVKRSKTSDALKANSVEVETMNEIGKGKLLEDKLDKGGVRPANYYASYDKEKNVYEQGNIAIPPNLRAFKFTKGTKVNNIIEEMVVGSSYGKSLTDKQPDDKGYREWFTIQTMVFSVPVKEVQSKKARMPKIYVFKVIPYKVHASLWMKPSDNPPGVKNIIREARKEYNYIYTGKNKDIINFDIKYDYRFFTPVPKDKGAVAEHNFAGESSTDKTKDGKKLVEGDGTEKETKFPMKQVGASDVQPIVSGMAAVGGDEKDKIARDFHNALINSNVDLVKCNLQIMGDPWFLSDSGIGNYQADAGPIMFDDSSTPPQMDYIRQQVFILLNFKTPFDYPDSWNDWLTPHDNSLLDAKGGAMTVEPFSGLYRVTRVSSEFSQGQFSQTLELLRMPNQSLTDDEADSFISKLKEQKDANKAPGKKQEQ